MDKVCDDDDDDDDVCVRVCDDDDGNDVVVVEMVSDGADAPRADVCILKKAQLLAIDLHRHFGDTSVGSNAPFSFADIDEATVCADNVLPCVLRHLGIIRVDDAVAARIDSGAVLSAREGIDTQLRAASIVACDEMVKAARTHLPPEVAARATSRALDLHLWQLGKEPEFRFLPRHAVRDTVFY
jgi:hypothetical protein